MGENNHKVDGAYGRVCFIPGIFLTVEKEYSGLCKSTSKDD